jgi:N-acetylglutamate synthase-like GNAT family acetyltransferase
MSHVWCDACDRPAIRDTGGRMTDSIADQPGPGDAANASPLGSAAFSERDFYLSEFRGRTLAFALPATSPTQLSHLREVLAELAENRTPVIVLSQDEETLDLVSGTKLAVGADPAWLGRLWRALREHSSVGITVRSDEDLASTCRRIALALRLAKLVWIDSDGPLRDERGERISWLDASAIDRLLAAGGPARPDLKLLLEEIAIMVRSGLPAVNLCAFEGVGDDLFTFEGSGTFFARERYLDVRRLGLDEFDTAHDLIRRGVTEGYLVSRGADQLDAVLANGFGVFVEGRYLAGLGALLPASADAGEICSLYTLTRFLGEGVGGHLVSFALEYAAELGFAYVFACTTSSRVEAFFARHGFATVEPDRIPKSKWEGYPPERQRRVICVRRDLA